MKAKSRGTILVVDDESDWLDTCSDILGDEGYAVLTSESAERGLRLLDERSLDLVLTDMTMPGMTGIELVREIGRMGSGCPIVLMTGFPTIETAIAALKAGASDYLLKPFSPEQLLHSVQGALDKTRLSSENQFLRSRVAELSQLGELIGGSAAMRKVYADLERAATMEASVLLHGESGTGKELAARIIHDKSPRRRGHFVPINCAAIPGELLENELFGHESGAFTGAGAARIGLFENASGGTVFLDEIGEMPPLLQAKLLRVVEDRKVRRLGSNKERSIDVRFVSATHRDLRELVAQKAFREDLYYRLNVITIAIPPLRERQEDIPLLLGHFLRRSATRERPAPSRMTPEARKAILDYRWPGNVRELANLAQFLLFADRDGTIDGDDLPQHLVTRQAAAPLDLDCSSLYSLPFSEAKKRLFDQMEENYVRHALLKHDWNVTAAAADCGIDRRTIHRIVQRLDLKRPH